MRAIYEVRRCIDSNHDSICTWHRTERAAQKAVEKAKAENKYEVVYYEKMDENGIVDEF